MDDQRALTVPEHQLTAQRQLVALWAAQSTDSDTPRRADLIRDKCAALVGSGDAGAMGFFTFTGKHPAHVYPTDVGAWRDYLADAGLAPSSVYGKLSRLSAFYTWLIDTHQTHGAVQHNPVHTSRPKAPKAYQNDSTQALSDADVRALMNVVRADANQPADLAAKRDYAMLRFYFATGKRRAEIVQLTGASLQLTNAAILIRPREKGGKYRATEVTDPGVRAALVDYLKASGRWSFDLDRPTLSADDPVWLRHDRAAGNTPQPITSHGFVKAFKQYARRAGLGDVHLHQTRHTVADVIGNEYGDVAAAQTVLGHENQQTTRTYLKTVAVKKDRYSRRIAERYGFDAEQDEK